MAGTPGSELTQDCLCSKSTLMLAENFLLSYLNRLNPGSVRLVGAEGQRDRGSEARGAGRV